MPIFDLPLEALHDYAGRNPRPAGFDAFWDQGLAEMRAVDPDVRIEPAGPAAPFAECADLWFTGVGGARLHAKYVRPLSAADGHPAVLQFHGYSGSSGDWSDKLAYAARGFTVLALDCRGQGGFSQDPGGVTGNTLSGHIIRGLEDGPEKLYYRQVFLDCAQLVSVAMSLPGVDPGRIGAFGGSQGGALTLACAALEPRVKLAAPWYPFLSDYQRVWEMDLAIAAYEELRAHFRSFDPCHEREEEIFTRLGHIDVQHLAPRIQARVLMAVGLMDTVCPPSTQFAAYNKIQSPKELVIYPDYGHEALPGWADRVWDFMGGL
ncbi:MAG: acetylxylan esterase [Candidatus Dormibacteria bacterium]